MGNVEGEAAIGNEVDRQGLIEKVTSGKPRGDEGSSWGFAGRSFHPGRRNSAYKGAEPETCPEGDQHGQSRRWRGWRGTWSVR